MRHLGFNELSKEQISRSSRRPKKLLKFNEKFLRLSSLSDWEKFGNDLAQRLAAPSGCRVDQQEVLYGQDVSSRDTTFREEEEDEKAEIY